LTIWHCNLSAELTKNAHLSTGFFGDFAHWETLCWNETIHTWFYYALQYIYLI